MDVLTTLKELAEADFGPTQGMQWDEPIEIVTRWAGEREGLLKELQNLPVDSALQENGLAMAGPSGEENSAKPEGL